MSDWPLSENRDYQSYQHPPAQTAGISVWLSRMLSGKTSEIHVYKNAALECTLRAPEGPHRFEAGTPNVSGAIGLAQACRFILSLGWEGLRAHEADITQHMRNAFSNFK